MARAVHRLDRVIAIFARRGEHVFLVIFPVPRFFPQRAIENLRATHFLVAVVLVNAPHVLLDLLPHRPAVRMPEHQPRRLFLHVKQIELLGKPAVIALFRLLQHVQIGVEFFLLRPRRAVYPLQHFVFRIAAPVSAGHLHQLEGF